MGQISITQAPKVLLSSVNISAPQVNVSSAGSQILGTQTAPSILSVSTGNLNVSSIASVASSNISGIASSAGIPTSVGGLASSVGIPTALPSVGQSLNTLGLPNITAASLSSLTGQISISGLPNLEFPKFPQFPGMDKVSIVLGASPAMLAKQLDFAKYVPPFVPGLKINMGMALAAVSLAKAALSANPSEIIKHLLNGILDDLKNQAAAQLNNAIDSTGVKNLQDQVNGAIGGAKDAFLVQYSQDNPPQTITNDDGSVTEVSPPTPNTSAFPEIKLDLPNSDTLKSVSTSAQAAETNVTGQTKSFSFPPNG